MAQSLGKLTACHNLKTGFLLCISGWLHMNTHTAAGRLAVLLKQLFQIFLLQWNEPAAGNFIRNSGEKVFSLVFESIFQTLICC